MLVKFFSNKKGGSSNAIKYLLNERELTGEAKVLKGDPNITEAIINAIERKQRATVGCLAFEEENIQQEEKYKLMQEFEEMLMPGMEERYNILWVEHTDKGRLELNFVIPKTDLETRKALQPHYYKEDQKRVELFQKVKNLEHNFTSPTDPSKARVVAGATKQINIQEDYKELNKLLHSLVEDGAIQNRGQLVELLQNNNIEVTRVGKDYISVKLPESTRAKRFKKGIYDEEFRSVGELREVGKRAREEVIEYDSRDTSKELEKYRQELSELTQYKFKSNAEKYKRTDIREYANKSKNYSKSNSDIKPNNRGHNDLLRSKENFFRSRVASTQKVQIQNKKNEVSEVHRKGQLKERQQRGQIPIYFDKGVEIDSIRTRVIRRVRAARAAQQKLISSIGAERAEIYRRIRENSKNIQEEHRRTRNPFEELHKQRETRIYRIKEQIGNVVKEFGNYINTKAKELLNKFEEVQEKEEEIKSIKQPRKRDRGLSM